MPVRILCLCTGNSCHSQMAEGWTRTLGGGDFKAESAGTPTSCVRLCQQVSPKGHWPLTDPAKARGTEEEIVTAFRATRDEVQRRVRDLLANF